MDFSRKGCKFVLCAGFSMPLLGTTKIGWSPRSEKELSHDYKPHPKDGNCHGQHIMLNFDVYVPKMGMMSQNLHKGRWLV